MVLSLVVLTTFFDYGCTATQRKNILDEALVNAKSFVAEEVLPGIKDKVADAVEAKLLEKEKEKLVQLDEILRSLGDIDPETGMISSKTWSDFDVDRNGELGISEAAKLQVYIIKRTSEKVAAGEISKDEAKKTVKSTGITLATLMAILLGKRGVDKLRGKRKKDDQALAAGAPTQPSQPRPPPT